MNKLRLRALLVGIALLLAVHSAAGQGNKKDKDAQLRSVRGVVSDKSDKPVQNSVVFLKNLRTNVMISHFSDAEGSYRFTGLDPNADYEIHAEANDEKSATRTISSLDGRKEITLNLKLDKKKE
ncbi:MAG TPA: carboxypeptidase-like regulatory domain-containing protein [Candidatus Saccharimonadales bacterium]|nr:carboxypeptidase-like regulatory domain-containing protein [Candidatus Saccharimonadales bacterium]